MEIEKMMNMKECIKFLETGLKVTEEVQYGEFRTNIEGIIKCLQMWEDFKKKSVYVEVNSNCTSPQPVYDRCTIGYLLDDFEQEYFSKKSMRTYLVETKAKEHPEWWDTPIYKMKANNVKEIEDKIKNDGRGLEIVSIKEFKGD